MLTWMENWLHGIIAVILFAVLVELLLPNSKFLKYTRLVIGLILLITLLSPLLKIFDQEYMTQIDASYVLWEKQLNSTEQQTLSLSDIQKKAKDIQEKREAATLELTAQTISSQMEQQLKQAGISYITKIKVELKLLKDRATEEPSIEAVQVFASLSTLSSANEQQADDEVKIVDIKPIEIGISESHSSLDRNAESTILETIPEADISLIYTTLQRNWNINKSIISIVAVDAEKR